MTFITFTEPPTFTATDPASGTAKPALAPIVSRLSRLTADTATPLTGDVPGVATRCCENDESLMSLPPSPLTSFEPPRAPSSMFVLLTRPPPVEVGRLSLAVSATNETLKSPVKTLLAARFAFALTVAFWPMKASVVFVMTGTLADAPTLTFVPAETVPEMMSRSLFSMAETTTLPAALMTAPLAGIPVPSTNARVVMLNTDTPAEPAIPTVPPAPSDAEIDVTSSCDFASITTLPFDATFACAAIHASVVFVMIATSTPAPMPTVPPPPSAPPMPKIFVRSAAATRTS